MIHRRGNTNSNSSNSSSSNHHHNPSTLKDRYTYYSTAALTIIPLEGSIETPDSSTLSRSDASSSSSSSSSWRTPSRSPKHRRLQRFLQKTKKHEAASLETLIQVTCSLIILGCLVFLGLRVVHHHHHTHHRTTTTTTTTTTDTFVPVVEVEVEEEMRTSSATAYKFDTMLIPPLSSSSYSDTRNNNNNNDNYHHHQQQQQYYDIRNCPLEPPAQYPYAWKLMEILEHWEPENTTIPTDQTLYQGLCIFDYHNDYAKALNYRQHEVPFIVINDPQVHDTVQRWNEPGYMDRMLGDVHSYRVEHSATSKFMYWNLNNPVIEKKWTAEGQRRRTKKSSSMSSSRSRSDNEDDDEYEDWEPPTTLTAMTYRDWKGTTDAATGILGSKDPHYYFRVDADMEGIESQFLFEELPFFASTATMKNDDDNDKEEEKDEDTNNNLYIVDAEDQRGIHCRFGQEGTIASNHFDSSRNFISVLGGGQRRYILSHPDQCSFLNLYPYGHPSERHSRMDWTTPNLTHYPEFAFAEGNEVVLQPGEMLYLPTNWFHYIISLTSNYQCNTRSGRTETFDEPLYHCGF